LFIILFIVLNQFIKQKKMKKNLNPSKVFSRISISFSMFIISFGMNAQTNVFDNVIAVSPNHTYLEAALLQQGLDVALKNNAATLTVFAPDDNAFLALATALGTNITGLLALPNLTDILTYHVLGTTVPASAVTNGAIVQPLSTTNTLKLTKTAGGSVYANQAKVTTADLTASNGVVHVLNGVLLPVETVADIAIDNGFSTLVTAVVTAELLPAVTNPFATLTVFAPTNTAFDNLAIALGVNLNGILALPQLADILLYHVLGTEVLSTQLVNGPVATLNGQNVTIDLTAGVKVNTSNVTLADLIATNGVVHVIDAVLLPSLASILDNEISDFTVYPNPTVETIYLKNSDATEYAIVNAIGSVVKSGKIVNNEISVSELQNGQYFIQITTNTNVSSTTKFVKQ